MANEYRATIKSIYRGNCPGRTNPRARQGYYVCGANILEASLKAYEQIKNVHAWAKPEDCEIELWKENITYAY